MTKEETLSYLKAYLDGDTNVGNVISLRSVLEAAIEHLEPSLPSNLDEAAEEYALDVKAKPFGNLVKDAFKSCAKWMAGQGVTVTKKIGKIDDGTNQIPTYCNGFEITELDVPFLNSKECGYGNEVIVQIRKKQ